MGRCGVDLVDDLKSNHTNRDEWRVLNKAIHAICEKYGAPTSGKNKNDYFISDENWGGVSQRLVVYEPNFLSLTLTNELANAIKKNKLLGAQIDVVFDFTKNNFDPEYLRGLLIVTGGGVYPAIFNVEALRSRFGRSFYSN